MSECEWKLLSHVWLFATPWIVACKAPLCMGFSRQEYWSGLPCPPPGDLPNPGIEPRLLWLLPCIFFTAGLLGKPLSKVVYIKNNTVLSCFSRVQLLVTLWTVAPPGSSVHGISQARILQLVAISFSREGLAKPGIKPVSPAVPASQEESLPLL